MRSSSIRSAVACAVALAPLAATAALAGDAPAAAPASGAVVVDLKGLPPPPPPAQPVRVQDKTRATYTQRCLHCHGEKGGGDGPLGVAMNPRPRAFSDRAWQTAATDAGIADVIRLGGMAFKKSPLMPPHPDIAADAALLADMVRLVRSFGEPGAPSVRLTLERVDAAAPGGAAVLAEKRVRLRAGGLRARFDAVAPGMARVRGFVDLDGDGRQSPERGEASFTGPDLVVGATEIVAEIALAPAAPPPAAP